MKKSLLIALCLLGALFSTHGQIPSVSLKSIEGETINTANLNNDGKPFIISFFASWCKPCLRELKAIHELYSDWQDETGVKLIAVSIDQGQNMAKVKPMVDAEGWEYEVLLDPNGDFKRAMNISLIPALFVFNGDGTIVSKHTSYTDGSEHELFKEIKALVK